MEDITRLTVHELVEKIQKNELTSSQIVEAYVAKIEEKELDVGAFITSTLEDAKNKLYNRLQLIMERKLVE